ncbi:hypothetical protein CDAR_97691 [Caerostris darwini]|uniref:Uncharacterized protein n=1 Tax=Caerostris darwini TaxID=1538125 RepID=A0AAV4NHA8_9ARAC|nr:hypothetical protein CDAR_97691 [Caerostris darwini]
MINIENQVQFPKCDRRIIHQELQIILHIHPHSTKDVLIFLQTLSSSKLTPKFGRALCPGILPRIRQMRNVGSGQGCLASCHFAPIINGNRCFGPAFYYWLIASSTICDWLNWDGRRVIYLLVIDDWSLVKKLSPLWCPDTRVIPKVSPLWCRDTRLIPKVSPLWCHDTRVIPKVSLLWCHDTRVIPKVSLLWCRDTRVIPKVSPLWYHDTGVIPKVSPLWCRDTRVIPKVSPLWCRDTRVIPKVSPLFCVTIH